MNTVFVGLYNTQNTILKRRKMNLEFKEIKQFVLCGKKGKMPARDQY